MRRFTPNGEENLLEMYEILGHLKKDTRLRRRRLRNGFGWAVGCARWCCRASTSGDGAASAASAALARILLANAQWKPATYAAAAAADADAAAANPAVADPWLNHDAFKLVDSDSGSTILFGHWVDQRMLLLLTSPDFRQVVIQWADARNGRPPGAEPEDLMASARDRRTALGYTGGAEPALLDKAKFSVVAVFGAEARDSEDARTALTHLHRKPCMRASQQGAVHPVHGPPPLEGPGEGQAAVLTDYAMFNLRASKPVALVWCAGNPNPNH